ncbi:polypeptide-transport-associated domain-containing protein [Nostoc sp. NIES-3756]|uniref:ShlB/FhaC/HecB family hemolysin secretion/activation protein n=1 Tax=Nostoc sp. NIES-3756 TaxID=1751286 RepID=UPI00072230FD|nr:ShlB/FhaC/HecB family hemolysin secretion/activation protein [Nostoc sp. NIES-3756]BAT52095.1 polypeptide-transport-associated domain-containing protein [Nostoc sp. NIES-3756]
MLSRYVGSNAMGQNQHQPFLAINPSCKEDRNLTSATGQKLGNFAANRLLGGKMENFYTNQLILLILSTVCLLVANGQRSLANDMTSSAVTSVIVQSPETAPSQPEYNQQPAADTATFPEKLYVREIRVINSTVFGQSDFAPVVKAFEGREITAEEARKAADAVTQLYLNQNYLNSRAIPVTPQAGATDGVLVIRVIEGRLADIDIEGTQRVNPAYIRSRIRLGASVPLNAVKLEEQLRLLRLDPLFTNVEASLRPTGQVGQSLLIVRVQEAKNFTSNFLIDNYSPPSVGGERFGVELGYRNLTGFGDLLTGAYYRTFTGGFEAFDFRYQIPVNAMNGTVQLRVSPSNSEITESPFKDLGIKGEQDLYEINYRQPLWRSPREEFALSLGFTYQDGQTFLFDRLPTPFGIGPDENGVSRTSVIKFGQDYISRSPQGAWFLRSQFNFGVGLFNATSNPDPIPDSHFFSWLGQIQRSQQLSNDNLLIIQADVQLTPNSLLPSQQFVIGGGQSVRGYRQNIRFGDNGVRLAVEDRIVVQRDVAGLPTIQLAPFFDMGVVWNQGDNPNKLPDQTFLAGAGLGMLWDNALGIDRLSLRLDYAIPFVDLQDRGNNVQDEGFYFSLRYQP